MALTRVPLEILSWADDMTTLFHMHIILKRDRNTHSLGWVQVLARVELSQAAVLSTESRVTLYLGSTFGLVSLFHILWVTAHGRTI